MEPIHLSSGANAMRRPFFHFLTALLLASFVTLAACGGDDGTEPLDDGPDDNVPTDTTDNGDPPDEKPAVLPTFQDVGIYSSQSPWNRAIPANPAVDPDSETMVESLLQSGDLVIQVKQFSATVFFADANTPRVDVELPCGPWWELGVTHLEDVPVPDFAEPAFDREGEITPEGCGEDADQDNHMVIVDLEERCEYDFWQARREGSAWVASWGNAMDMNTDGVYGRGLSTRGSGFAFLGGVIWPDELAGGEIRHALAFSYPFAKSGGPVPPATESDGTSDEAFAIPEGALLQLDPELDLDELGLTGYQRTVARAMQEYGLRLVDQGGESGIGLYAVDPNSVTGNPYAGLLPDDDFPLLDGIPLESMRVLELGEQDPDFAEGLAVQSSRCASYR